jgi:type I restriction enzyme S subunit
MPADDYARTSWPVVPLGEVADITLGGTPSTDVRGYWGGVIRWMASGEVNKRHVYEVDGRITESGLAASNATLVDPPSVAIGLAGQGKTRGTAALVHLRVCTNQSIALVRGRTGKLDTGFLFHNLDNRYEELRGRSAGGGRAGLSREILEKVPIGLPTLCEQSRIAAVLDTVDDAIAETDSVIAKLAQVRAGLLNDLLTRGLDENGELRDPITHSEQFQHTPLGQVPREWRFSRLDEVLDGIDAGKSPDYPDSPAPAGEWGVLKVSAIWPEGFRPHENKRVTRALHQVPSYEVRSGDLLISRSNTYDLVGIVCLVEAAPPRLMLCDKTLRLRLKADRGLNAYFALLLQTRMARVHFETHATGTSGSMKNISQDVIRGLPLAYPELAEQRRIMGAARPLAHVVGALDREISKLRALRAGLATDLLAGRVRVPESFSAAESTQ